MMRTLLTVLFVTCAIVVLAAAIYQKRECQPYRDKLQPEAPGYYRPSYGFPKPLGC
jgi:hypothetical protein